MGTGRKRRRSVRIALVLGAVVASTAVIGWGGLAAWSAYTENAGNSAAAGTLAHARSLARETGRPLSAIFLAAEAERSGKRPEALEALMLERIGVMRQALARGLATPQMSRSGLIRGGAHRLDQWLQGGGSLLAPAFTRLVAAALAVAEVNACMGRIVASPTAGACGVLPAALFTVAREKGVGDEALVRAFVKDLIL